MPAAASPRPLAQHAGLAPARNPVDEGIDRRVEGRIAVERLEGRYQRQRRRAGQRVECPELRLVLVADRAQEPFGLRQGIAEDEGVEREPKSSGFGIRQPRTPQRAVDHLAGGIIGRPRRVEAEVQMEEAWMTVSKIPGGCGEVWEIGGPVGAGGG